MSSEINVYEVILTASVTLLGGVILLVMKEFVTSFIIDPAKIVRQRLHIAVARVIFYSNRLTNYFPSELSEDDFEVIKSIRNDLRNASTKLSAAYDMVPFKRFSKAIRILPSAEAIGYVSSDLIYLHNSILYEGRRDHVRNEIEMNDNRIERIKAVGSGRPLPEVIKVITT